MPHSAVNELRHASSPPQPLPPCRDVHPVRYEIAASGPLPAFDPRTTVKQKLLSARQARAFNRMVHSVRHVSFPMYLVGYLLRGGVIFGPVEIGRALGPLALVLQLPVMLYVLSALRVEFVRVLARTFEFWFLVLTATVWSMSLGLYLQDARAVLAPQCYVDFVNLVLIETYFQDSRSVVVSAAISAAFQLALSVGVSLGAVDGAQSLKVADLDTHALTLKDVLVNTMATMIMLLVRLAYRKAESLRKQRQAAHQWTQSISYRCRTTLREVAGSTIAQRATNTLGEVNTRPASSESPLQAPVNADRAVTTGIETVNGKQLLRMRFVSTPIVFDAANTVVPCFSTALLQVAKRWPTLFTVVHRGAGIAGFALIPVVFDLGSHDNAATTVMAKTLSTAALGATLAFWTPLLCCAQRELTRRLWTSFDFVFVYTQLLLSHLALMDMLAWRPIACSGVLASFVWIQGALSIDKVPPVMRARLGWRSWFIVPVLVAHMTLQLLICAGIFAQHGSDLRNRLLLDHAIGRHHVQFYVVPFFVSRQVTIFVWCMRILHRFRTRKSEHELLLLLGNVEYNYENWHQAQKRAQDGLASPAAVAPLPPVPPRTLSSSRPPRDAEQERASASSSRTPKEKLETTPVVPFRNE